MIYSVKVSKSFEKDFARLDSLTQSRMLVSLEKMKANPFFDAKKLKNIAIGIWRSRMGDYRIRFDVIGHDIYLYRVRHRKDIYK